jgi:hypothetical protein
MCLKVFLIHLHDPDNDFSDDSTVVDLSSAGNLFLERTSDAESVEDYMDDPDWELCDEDQGDTAWTTEDWDDLWHTVKEETALAVQAAVAKVLADYAVNNLKRKLQSNEVEEDKDEEEEEWEV